MKTAEYEVVRYPSSRIGTLDMGQLGLRKHHIAGLLEVDVTEAIAEARASRARVQRISFFAWMVKTIAAAIAENPCIHAQKGRKHCTILFRDIDVSVMVEKAVDGDRVPLPLLIRKANEKTAEEIHAEIQAAQSERVQDESGYVLSEGGPSRTTMRL